MAIQKNKNGVKYFCVYNSKTKKAEAITIFAAFGYAFFPGFDNETQMIYCIDGNLDNTVLSNIDVRER